MSSDCDVCGKAGIRSHYRCVDCGKWVGRCCLAGVDPNVCAPCDQHPVDGILGEYEGSSDATCTG